MPAFGDTIGIRQQKTGARLMIPIYPKLKAELEATTGKHLTCITTEYGAPFSVARFGGWFSDAARAGCRTGPTRIAQERRTAVS